MQSQGQVQERTRATRGRFKEKKTIEDMYRKTEDRPRISRRQERLAKGSRGKCNSTLTTNILNLEIKFIIGCVYSNKIAVGTLLLIMHM